MDTDTVEIDFKSLEDELYDDEISQILTHYKSSGPHSFEENTSSTLNTPEIAVDKLVDQLSVELKQTADRLFKVDPLGISEKELSSSDSDMDTSDEADDKSLSGENCNQNWQSSYDMISTSARVDRLSLELKQAAEKLFEADPLGISDRDISSSDDDFEVSDNETTSFTTSDNAISDDECFKENPDISDDCCIKNLDISEISESMDSCPMSTIGNALSDNKNCIENQDISEISESMDSCPNSAINSALSDNNNCNETQDIFKRSELKYKCKEPTVDNTAKNNVKEPSSSLSDTDTSSVDDDSLTKEYRNDYTVLTQKDNTKYSSEKLDTGQKENGKHQYSTDEISEYIDTGRESLVSDEKNFQNCTALNLKTSNDNRNNEMIESDESTKTDDGDFGNEDIESTMLCITDVRSETLEKFHGVPSILPDNDTNRQNNNDMKTSDIPLTLNSDNYSYEHRNIDDITANNFDISNKSEKCKDVMTNQNSTDEADVNNAPKSFSVIDDEIGVLVESAHSLINENECSTNSNLLPIIETVQSVQDATNEDNCQTHVLEELGEAYLAGNQALFDALQIKDEPIDYDESREHGTEYLENPETEVNQTNVEFDLPNDIEYEHNSQPRCDSYTAGSSRCSDKYNLTEDGQFKCNYCCVRLSDEERFHEHFDKYHRKKYTCKHCGMKFKRCQILAIHVKKQHTGEHKYKTQRVSKDADSRKRKDNKTQTCYQNNGKIVPFQRSKSKVCEKTGATLSVCGYCSAAFNKQQTLACHVRDKHLVVKDMSKKVMYNGYRQIIKESEKDNPKKSSTAKPANIKERTEKAPINQLPSKKKEHRKKRDVTPTNTHEPVTKKPKRDTKASRAAESELDEIARLQKDYKIQIDQVYRCQYCTQWYFQKAILSAHVKKHILNNDKIMTEKETGDGACHESTTSFIQSHNRQHFCKYCPKSFKSLSNLKTHVLRHLGEIYVNDDSVEERYVCSICGEKSHSILTNHLFRHCNSQVLKMDPSCLPECSYCGQPFLTKKILNSHEQKHVHFMADKQTKAVKPIQAANDEGNGVLNHRNLLRVKNDKSKNYISESENISKDEQVLNMSHDEVTTDNTGSNVSQENNNNLLEKIPFQCGMCLSRFPSSQYLLHHMTLHMKGKYIFKVEQEKHGRKLVPYNASVHTVNAKPDVQNMSSENYIITNQRKTTSPAPLSKENVKCLLKKKLDENLRSTMEMRKSLFHEVKQNLDPVSNVQPNTDIKTINWSSSRSTNNHTPSPCPRSSPLFDKTFSISDNSPTFQNKMTPKNTPTKRYIKLKRQKVLDIKPLLLRRHLKDISKQTTSSGNSTKSSPQPHESKSKPCEVGASESVLICSSPESVNGETQNKDSVEANEDSSCVQPSGEDKAHSPLSDEELSSEPDFSRTRRAKYKAKKLLSLKRNKVSKTVSKQDKAKFVGKMHKRKLTKKSRPVKLKNFKKIGFTSGEWYECCLCLYTCATETDYLAHFSGHRNIKKKQLFKCRFCSRRFLSMFHVNKHELLHRDNAYQCTVCTKQFPSSTEIVKHLALDHSYTKCTVIK